MKQLISVLIVDDEYLVRNLLKSCIDWTALGYQIVGEAELASEALELITNLEPDVVITDIRMPKKDGLELSVQIKEQYPDMKVLILTGHGEFQYAKRAIEAGVDNYLLKPINNDELMEVLEKLARKIWEEKEQRMRMALSMKAEKDRMFIRLIKNQLNHNELQSTQNEYFIQSDRYSVYAVEMSNREADRGKVSSWISQEVERLADTFVVPNVNGKLILISGSDNRDVIHMFEACPDKEHTNIGVGTTKNKLSQISESYQEACIALNYSIITGPGATIHYATRKDLARKDGDVNYSPQLLDYAIQTGHLVQIMEQIKAALYRIDLDQKNALHAIQLEAVRLETLLRNQASSDADNDKSPIMSFRYLQEIMKYLEEIGRKLLSDEEAKNAGISQTVRTVQEYLEKHYSDQSLTLTSVASIFYLNPSYLSRTFKAETGVSFVEYVTQLRMKRAEYLLSNTDMKIFEIADEVGYKDPHYFSMSFRKVKGITVSEYRKNIHH